MSTDQFIHGLGLLVIGAPAALMALLGLAAVLGGALAERTVARAVQTVIVIGLASSVAILILMLVVGTRSVPIDLGHLVSVPHFHFDVKLLFDRLSVPFVILTFVLCGTVSAFASRYMHREQGFNRFFGLMSVFLVGMLLTSVAGTIGILFAGWELVGLSSALLVGFFHERPMPVRNALQVWTIYRASDAALLIAAILLHQFSGHGDFTRMLGSGPWPEGSASITQWQAFVVGILFLIAAAGKSALVPFSGWLPRAMEGPTPSSAIFYGALSVHLGAYLLLRVGPILELSVWLCAIVIALGLVTAVFAAIAGHAQTDIKSALAFASLAQVGLIVAEIGAGLRYVALVHILGHACLRTLQFLRAPTLLHDYHHLENAVGRRLPRLPVSWEQHLPPGLRVRLYRFALNRGYFDDFLFQCVARPIQVFFRGCNNVELRWTAWISGPPVRDAQATKETIELDEAA